MFRTSVISLTLLWLMLAATIGWIFYVPSSKDFDEYQRLMEYSLQLKKEEVKKPSQLAKQERKRVSKQILFNKDGQRLQSRLRSESSELSYGHTELGTELVEHFKNVECTLQEKLIFEASNSKKTLPLDSQQLVRHLIAEKAAYSYKTGILEAYEVELASYKLPGIQWPNSFQDITPILQGNAQKIELSLFHQTSFKAQGFQGALHEWGNGW